MTLRHFRIFLAVCERLSMTEAARQLHISQPSVTQAIHEMEEHYGIVIRTPGSSYLPDRCRRELETVCLSDFIALPAG